MPIKWNAIRQYEKQNVDNWYCSESAFLLINEVRLSRVSEKILHPPRLFGRVLGVSFRLEPARISLLLHPAVGIAILVMDAEAQAILSDADMPEGAALVAVHGHLCVRSRHHAFRYRTTPPRFPLSSIRGLCQEFA